MTTIKFEGKSYSCAEQETVLDTFLRNGIETSFSCRSGICQVCLMRSNQNNVSEAAQIGLRKSLVERNYFLSCQCIPISNMDVIQPRPADIFNRVVVYKKEWMSKDICRVLLESATQLYYHAGQFINLLRDDGLLRSYSLASVPFVDVHLEIHVKRIPNGQMSNWILDQLQEGDELEFQGAIGDCYYRSGNEQQNILLVGTGTGLAPLIGIIRDALMSGHKGEIYLYHGSRFQDNVYFRDTLQALAEQYENFHFILCVSNEPVNADFVHGRASEVALSHHNNLTGWQVFLCGLPAMVYSMREKVRLLGVKKDNIFSDPFELSHTPVISRMDFDDKDNQLKKDKNSTASRADSEDDQSNSPKPDPEMWAALKEGQLLTEILDDFYTQVYQDPLLSPYFEDFTKDWVAKKQFSYLHQIFTGNKVFLGNRPRNAHHWMVISDSLFDYRENLMLNCLRRHGLAEHLVKRWRAMEERFRKDIVKSKPWNKILDGIEIPTEGYKDISVDMDCVCDNCLKPIESGERVRYHVRLAKVYCSSCISDQMD